MKGRWKRAEKMAVWFRGDTDDPDAIISGLSAALRAPPQAWEQAVRGAPTLWRSFVRRPVRLCPNRDRQNVGRQRNPPGRPHTPAFAEAFKISSEVAWRFAKAIGGLIRGRPAKFSLRRAFPRRRPELEVIGRIMKSHPEAVAVLTGQKSGGRRRAISLIKAGLREAKKREFPDVLEQKQADR